MIERKKKQQIIADMAGEQEIMADMLSAVLAETFGILRSVQKLLYGKGSTFYGMAKQT